MEIGWPSKTTTAPCCWFQDHHLKGKDPNNFNPNIKIKLTQVDRNDDGGGEESEMEISIFTYPARKFEHEIHQIFIDIKIRQVEMYVLLNYKEVDLYIEPVSITISTL